MTTNQFASKAADYLRSGGLNPQDFPELQSRLLKNYVRYLRREYENQWYKAEEMLLQSPEALGILVEDLYNAQKYKEALSIALRNNLIENNLISKKDILEGLLSMKDKTELLPNILFEKDDFSIIIISFNLQVPTDAVGNPQVLDQYLHLKDLGVSENQVQFISQEDEQLKQAIDNILASKETGYLIQDYYNQLGIDTEFRQTGSTKLDSGPSLVALVQLSTKDMVYLFDGVTLAASKSFGQFLDAYFSNENILKIGHTLIGDIDHIRKTFKMTVKECKGAVDVRTIFQDLHKKETKTSLCHITEKLLGKPLSKLDQCSTWVMRPLRRAQMHYGAMDAVVCLHLYEKLKLIQSSRNEQQKQLIQEVI